MSEYQYYEFQAVDNPLTETQIEKLRAISYREEKRFSEENRCLVCFAPEKGEPDQSVVGLSLGELSFLGCNSSSDFVNPVGCVPSILQECLAIGIAKQTTEMVDYGVIIMVPTQITKGLVDKTVYAGF